MATVARGRETTSDVIGVGRALIVLQVAVHAGTAGQLVVAVDMALRALQRRMRAGQRESRAGMVESRAQPVDRAMAILAGLREIGLHVIGIGGGLVILQVARDALRAGQVVIVVDVTLRALQRRVRAGKRKSDE